MREYSFIVSLAELLSFLNHRKNNIENILKIIYKKHSCEGVIGVHRR